MSYTYKQVFGLNITVHPEHNPTIYSNMIKYAYEMKRTINVGGRNNYMVISRIEPEKDGIIIGRITRFSGINSDEPWFDVDKMEIAEEDQMKNIVIPSHLKPNSCEFWFGFDSKHHIMVIDKSNEGKNISIKYARTFIEKLLTSDEILKEFGEVNVNEITDINELDRMLARKDIKRIIIKITRPNPDDILHLSVPYFERLRSMNVNEQTTDCKASDGACIVPDDNMIKDAQISALNGRTECYIQGEKGTKKIKISTDNHPKIISIPIDTENSIQTIRDAIKRFF